MQRLSSCQNQSIGWHWIFFVNVPLGVFTVLMGLRWIVENKGLGIGRDVDVLGALLVTAADVPAQDAGLASGIVNASLQLSAALGVAVLGTIATDHTQTLITHGTAPLPALLGGYHLAFEIATGCVAAAVIATLILLRRPRRPGPVPELAVQESA